MSMINIKSKLKKIRFLYNINIKIKSWILKRRYYNLREYYKRISKKKNINYDEKQNFEKVKNALRSRGLNINHINKENLRILYVGTDSEQDYGGIIQGLLKFGEVIPFKQKEGLYGQIMPCYGKNDADRLNGKRLLEIIKKEMETKTLDILIGQMWARTMNPEALQKVREMGIPVVNIAMDDRQAFRGKNLNGNWTGASGLIGSIDLACTAAKECCLWYLVEGCNSIYLPEASDSELFSPSNKPKLYDVIFVGKAYGIRSKIIDKIEKSGIHVECFGSDWPNGRISTEKMAEHFARSRIVLGVGTIGHCSDFYSLKMRDFDGPMSGSLYITHDNIDLYDLYDIGKEIITYQTPEECSEKINYYLKHQDEAAIIAKAGRKRAVRDHTWEKRFEKMFKTLGILKKG